MRCSIREEQQITKINIKIRVHRIFRACVMCLLPEYYMKQSAHGTSPKDIMIS